MISKDDMFEPTLAACPTFVPAWRAFLNEWEDSKEGLPYYLALGDLARHLVEQLDAGTTNNSKRSSTWLNVGIARGTATLRRRPRLVCLRVFKTTLGIAVSTRGGSNFG